jgi:energy-coupling factor transport system permease protein
MIGARSIAEPTIKDTVIHRMDPRAKILILISTAFIAVTLDNQKSMFLLFLTVLSGFVLARMPAIKIKTLVLLLAFLVWGTIYSQALFYSQLPRTVIFTIISPDFPVLGWMTSGGLFVYEEGLHHGAIQALRSASILSLGLLMCWTTDSRDMLNGLVGLRIPYSVAFMVVTAVRFLPIIITEVATVITVQRLRGFNPKKFGSGIIKTSLNILTPTLANCVRRTGTLAVSIQSRAFRQNLNRTYLKKLKFSETDKILVIIFIFAAISIVIIKLLYNMYTSGIFYTSGLRPVYAIARGYL